MISAPSAPLVEQVDNTHDRISWPRLVWVAPLTLIAALAACFAIRFVVQTLNPNLTRMPQLREPMIALTVEGVVAAIIVFALFAAFVPRPIFWYRTLGIAALLVSFLPDIALALGGAPMRLSMSVMGPLTSIGQPGPGGPGGGGPPPGGFPGGPPPGASFTTPIEQVLVLMLLHVAVATVCIALLTTLTRKRAAVAVAQEA